MLKFYRYFVFGLCYLTSVAQHRKDEKCGKLFLTVNAVQNLLQFNWDFTSNCEIFPDTLILYYENTNLTTPKIDLETISVRENPKGQHLSTVQFGNPKFPGNWNEDDKYPVLGSHCYPFRVRSEHNNIVIDNVCLKIEPNWMENFGKLNIGKMMIPGTHNSGAWRGRHISLVKRYTITQDTNLWGQLVSGIRYFDIRVGLYEDMRTKLWINHGPIRCSKMEEEFQHIVNFLRKSPKEIVILHFHSFEMPLEFTDDNHKVVLDLIQEILGNFILSPGEVEYNNNGPTLEEIWATNKRLLVSYNDRYQTIKNSWLWNNIPHKWGDKTEVTELYDYLKSVNNYHYHPETPFCALISVLTPNVLYIIENIDKSLRHMSDEVNPLLNQWLRDEYWAQDTNIIATDFFMGNDVINIAIETNTNKLEYINLKNNEII